MIYPFLDPNLAGAVNGFLLAGRRAVQFIPFRSQLVFN